MALALTAMLRVAWWPDELPQSPTPVWPEPLSGPSYNAVDALLEMDAALLRDLAMGEDPRAPVAVVWVALNRARCGGTDFLDCDRPIVEAVTSGRAFGTWKRGQWRPSWAREWNAPDVEGAVYAVMLGYVPDPTGGATHFHRAGTWTPPWAPKRDQWEMHGSHWFYKVGE